MGFGFRGFFRPVIHRVAPRQVEAAPRQTLLGRGITAVTGREDKLERAGTQSTAAGGIGQDVGAIESTREFPQGGPQLGEIGAAPTEIDQQAVEDARREELERSRKRRGRASTITKKSPGLLSGETTGLLGS